MNYAPNTFLEYLEVFLDTLAFIRGVNHLIWASIEGVIAIFVTLGEVHYVASKQKKRKIPIFITPQGICWIFDLRHPNMIFSPQDRLNNNL